MGFLSFSSLLTYGGATVAVTALTELCKPLIAKLGGRISMRAVSYVIALLILLAAAFFTGARSAPDYLICAVNAALVSLSSNGGYDLISALINEETEDDGEDNT